jgi:hypothetical protein
VAALARLLNGPAAAGAAAASAPSLEPSLEETVPGAEGPGSFTPSDFPEAGLSQESLDRLLSRVRGLPS